MFIFIMNINCQEFFFTILRNFFKLLNKHCMENLELKSATSYNITHRMKTVFLKSVYGKYVL